MRLTPAAASVALLLAACSTETLRHDLEEGDANDIVAALRHGGISAHKVREADAKTFAVLLPGDRFAEGVRIIEAHQLPRPRFPGLEVLARNSSLIQTPQEARALESRALADEISRFLVRIPGVQDASTLVALPDRNDLSAADFKPGPSASVLIRYRPGPESGPPLKEAELQRIVAAAVPELALSPEHVVARIEPGAAASLDPGVETRFEVVLGIRVAEESALALKLLLLASAVLVLLSALGAAWSLLHRGRRRPVAAH